MTNNKAIEQILEKKGRNEAIENILKSRGDTHTLHKRASVVLDKLNEIENLESLNEFLMSNSEASTAIQEIIEEEFWYFDYKNLIGESSKYSPVAAVSCLELYTKSVYASLIDYGSPFVEKLNKFKLDFSIQVAIELKSNSLTLGDFASHQIPASNFENITGNLNKLLDIDFIKELKCKHILESGQHYQFDIFDQGLSEEELDAKEKRWRADEANEFISGLKKIISSRHLICHENTHNHGFECGENYFLTSTMYVKLFIILTESIIDDAVRKVEDI